MTVISRGGMRFPSQIRRYGGRRWTSSVRGAETSCSDRWISKRSGADAASHPLPSGDSTPHDLVDRQEPQPGIKYFDLRGLLIAGRPYGRPHRSEVDAAVTRQHPTGQ